jgi:hypothetical protein
MDASPMTPDRMPTNSHSGSENPPLPPMKDESPEARMKRRWPQPIRIGDLVGRPVVDDDDVILGHVREVVRTPAGKILLIVPYSRWFGWFGRPVAVPIEVVVSIGRNVASVDMQPQAYAAAPTWNDGGDRKLGDDEMIRIAIGKR